MFIFFLHPQTYTKRGDSKKLSSFLFHLSALIYVKGAEILINKCKHNRTISLQS